MNLGSLLRGKPHRLAQPLCYSLRVLFLQKNENRFQTTFYFISCMCFEPNVSPCRYCHQGALVNINPVDIARFYLAVRKEAAAGGLFDGAGHRVHYNMRVLVRALK